MTNDVASSSRADRLFHLFCICGIALPLGCGAWFFVATLVHGWPGLVMASQSLFNSALGVALLELWWQMEFVGVAAALAIPLGIGVAVYLEHLAHRGFFATIARRAIALLAAVPSVLYGLCGVTVLVVCLDVQSKFFTLACCLALFLFPIVVERTRAALQTVSPHVHEASLALGADPFRALTHVILPLAMPSIASEMLLVLARALGTVAPLLVVNVFTAKPDAKITVLDPLSIRVFHLSADPTLLQPEYAAGEAALAVLLLLGVLVVLQIVAKLLTRRHANAARHTGLSERGTV